MALTHDLVHTDMPFRGEVFNVKHHQWRCKKCGHTMLGDDDATEALRAVIAAHQAAHGLLTAVEMQKLRAAKGWSQRELANHTRLGIATIKRLERGGVLQTRANDQLLRGCLADIADIAGLADVADVHVSELPEGEDMGWQPCDAEQWKADWTEQEKSGEAWKRVNATHSSALDSEYALR
jgi:putative zinc finger/helix-turn-helix YgiT family protein